MSVIGLSIIIASFSIFCYRYPPTSWFVLRRLPPFVVFSSLRKPRYDASSIELSEVPDTKEDKTTEEPDGVVDSKSPFQYEREAVTLKEDLDRKAMPPPPPPLENTPPTSQKPSSPPNELDSPTTPRTSTSPSLTLAYTDGGASIPSFPALNSAQRASSGVRGPPRLDAAHTPPAGLMPPPFRSPLPDRGASSSSLLPPPTHASIPTKPRRKVLLSPGHSPLDWARLSASPLSNLSGLPPGTPYLRVPPSLLKTMNGRRGKDTWTVLGGKVYNITPYAPYHPGGEPELMKAAGRDGTRLFGEVHPWVNWEGMLEGCLVGIAVEEVDLSGGRLDEQD